MKRYCSLIISGVGVLLFILGLVLIFAVIPPIIDDKIEEEIILKNGTEQFERFLTVPQPLHYKIYFFHIKNPDEVHAGAKPIVEEKGPYVYSMRNEKKDVRIHSDDEEIEFRVKLNIQFDSVASAPLTENDEIEVLYVPMNAAFMVAEELGQGGVMSSAYNKVFNNPKTMFIKTTVKEYLFEGVKFCVDRSAIPSIVCSLVEKQGSQTIRKSTTDRGLLFSFFNHKNTSDDGLWNIYSGKKDILDVGQLTSWNNETYMKLWKDGNSTCNKVQGTDSTMYRPYRHGKEPDDFMWVFNSDICRAVSVHYKEKREFNGIETFRYEANDAFMVKPEKCYCLGKTTGITDPDTGCLYGGALELYTCQKAPVVLTHPHFMNADQIYKDTVDGLRNDTSSEEHGTFIEVEPHTGTPIKGSKRVQFNMFIRPIKNLKFTENLTTALVPIMWVDEGIILNDENLDLLNESLFDKLLIADAVTWTLVGVGAVIGVAGIIWWFCKK
ncbi:sensory neuron membrane protein 2 [Ctenocephalides felis]|uniref:sensory neuron membrane protein 2 n=1 Tax=Ctenocephalides felis TaxID=7515 RepID=UPI000E6E5284|nr:sensory neuron membrane protein 2 [Ctenocephalides felis]